MRGSNTRAVFVSRTAHNDMVLQCLEAPRQPNLPIPNLPKPRHIPARHATRSKAAPAALEEVELLLCYHAVPVARLGCSKLLELATELYSTIRRAARGR